RSRLLCEIFQAFGVDVVFSGHSHMYERSFPLTLSLVPQPDGRPVSEDGQVRGHIFLDKEFGGKSLRKPKGVIYVTSGAGGKGLSADHRPNLTSLPEYLRTVELDNMSVTVVETAGNQLTLQQVSTGSKLIDEFVIEK
ncbi:MAG: phosphohydrolase, partial [Cyanobacteria bacterium]|nr:phosphohydrolase [Cyanobacteriota bacterium]